MAALTTDLEAKIEAYLLGRLPGGEQTKIEALLFEDDDVFEAIRDAEDDLIDRYVAGELSQTDRDAFEHAFAVSASRQERIALARALSHAVAPSTSASGGSTSDDSASGDPAPVAAARVVPPPVAPEPVVPAPAAAPPAPADSPRRHSRRISDARRLILPAGATLAAALVLAITWRSLKPETTSQSGPEAGDVASGSGETVIAPPDGVAIATFSLGRSELRRGSGSLPRLGLPRGTTAIRLEPELRAPVPAGHSVTVRRIEGPVVWEETARADIGSGRFSVTVPARLLGAGDYVLSLAAPGAPPEDREEYPFRIVVPD